ncbi:unnamed protein product [Lymnaea stagnalis]|uniref:Poly [ADP-ribose] polymerase n=1 Tax=Lymnaea stagnalis TaxID=6523 RepID=A0AAV2H6J0_LYMST
MWVSVKLQKREESAIRSLFNQTSADFRITHITRLENSKLWEKYVLKRKHMVNEIGVSKINERALFHGTSHHNIPVICQEGFDTRVETKNGALYGKGENYDLWTDIDVYSQKNSENLDVYFILIFYFGCLLVRYFILDNCLPPGTYFSTTSNYSQRYAGSSNKLIIARVLCGNSVQGNPSYKRPPRDISGRMYDSCVNVERGPSIYCLFDNSQFYPAYIIEYTKK